MGEWPFGQMCVGEAIMEEKGAIFLEQIKSHRELYYLCFKSDDFIHKICSNLI